MISSSQYIRRVDNNLSSDSAADGNYDFSVNPLAGPNNLIEYFYFVDANGDQVDATAGTVTITISSGFGIFMTIDEGDFNAALAMAPDRTKPNGFGTADIVRVNLNGVLGASGFRALCVQHGN